MTTSQPTLQEQYDAALKELTTKQRAFVLEYLSCLNASEAARRAKYTHPNKRGPENVVKRGIASAIAAGMALHAMPAPEVLYRLAARARATIADVIALPSIEPRPEPDPSDFSARLNALPVEGERTGWSLDLVKAQQTGGIHQIKKIKTGKYGDEIEAYDPLPALELLAKHLKLTDDGGILKYLDLSKLTPEQLQRIADGDDPLAVLLNTTEDPGQSPA